MKFHEKVMRHSFNQNQKDEEVYFEKDDEFNLYSYKSKSRECHPRTPIPSALFSFEKL